MEHISTGKTDAIFARILDRYALISLIMVLVGGLASGPLVALIAPPGYADAARLLPILIGATLLSGSSYVLEIGNLAAVKTHWTSMARGLSMITNFGIAFLLVGKFGALAIAMGMLGAAITRAVVSYFTAQSSHRIAYRPISVAMLIVGIPAVTWLMVSWRQVAAMDFSFLK
jgi:O-antigen/teichoic acid export membrane protein